MGSRGWTVAFVAAAAAYALVLVLGAPGLPERVPLHYGTSGEADRWGSRTELVLGLTGLGVLMVLVFGGGAALGRRLPLAWVNVPNPGYWKRPDNAAELRRRLAADLLHLGAVTLAWLAAEVAVTLAAVRAGRDDLPAASVALLLAYLGYVTVWCAWLVRRRYRVPADVSAGGTATR